MDDDWLIKRTTDEIHELFTPGREVVHANPLLKDWHGVVEAREIAQDWIQVRPAHEPPYDVQVHVNWGELGGHPNVRGWYVAAALVPVE